jgi:glycosyltransferase involved in cell wall biosynthesis
MKFLIINIVKHTKRGDEYYGYGPYIREMNLWGKYVDQVIVLAPRKETDNIDAIDTAYTHKNLQWITVPNFNILTFWQGIKAVFKVPVIYVKCFFAMAKSDHIHLRCPGNISLVACVVQMFFPNKLKSTKYAGNWDPNSNQPWTYRLQQAILRNTFLTRNMKVLVYGDWPGETTNVYPFISATYKDVERVPFSPKNYDEELVFVFAGMLVPGKRPLLTIQFIEQLNQQGIPARLELFGNGPLMSEIKSYVEAHNLENQIYLRGNQDKTIVKAALLSAHFNILLSKSEGWPKAVAEGMFFGCIPVATSVSCVNWMMGYGSRGILVEPNLEAAVSQFITTFKSADLDAMAREALCWSQQYTLDRLEGDIRDVLNGSFESRV